MPEIRPKYEFKITKIPNQIFLAYMPWRLRSSREETGVQSLAHSVAGQARRNWGEVSRSLSGWPGQKKLGCSLSLPQWLTRPEETGVQSLAPSVADQARRNWGAVSRSLSDWPGQKKLG